MNLCEARAETLKLLLEGKGEPHPFSAMFPPITAEDFDNLVDDIKKNGLLHPIIIYQDKILDGNNRYRACLQTNVKPRFTELVESSDAAAQRYVISANIHRRHIDPETRKKILATLLKLDPSKSNRQLGEETKLDHKTVGAVREKLEQRGEIPHVESRTDSAGRTQPSKKTGKGKSSVKRNEQDAVKFPKVTNASTALKAYNVFEQHLLDALQDVNDKSVGLLTSR